jgi:5-carboxymethyl-2-hydroxymuconate isomerase
VTRLRCASLACVRPTARITVASPAGLAAEFAHRLVEVGHGRVLLSLREVLAKLVEVVDTFWAKGFQRSALGHRWS